MTLSDIKQAELGGKRVLVRVDFNVEFDKFCKPKEKYKIEAAKGTIEYLLSKDCRVALLSHLGRPQAKEEEFSFKKYCHEISKILNVELVFVDDCVGDKVKESLGDLKHGQVLLLENVRFYKEDAGADDEFAKKLSENFEIFVNEAFGASHRDHSSVTKITRYLPFFAGFKLLKEVEELLKIRENFERPAVSVIGGAKIETKLPVINFFAKNYDKVLVGGKLGLETEAGSLPENVIIPKDYKENNLDIGKETINEFKKELISAKTIVWNGPMGKFEEKPYDEGTIEILDSMIENKYCYKVAGGGETVQVLEEKNLIEQFSFVSTGGGAMLEFLEKGTLPGVDALKK